jgi:hypothetical protein
LVNNHAISLSLNLCLLALSCSLSALRLNYIELDALGPPGEPAALKVGRRELGWALRLGGGDGFPVRDM